MSRDVQRDAQERTMPALGATAAVAPTPGAEAATASDRPAFSARDLLRRDWGQLPVFIGLIVIAVYSQIASGGFFFNGQNLTNLVQQIITTAVLGVAAVLVLLIAEIDLSLSAVAFLCGAIMGVLSARAGWPPIPAVLVGIAAGALIGAINGFFVAVVRVPSFIVTLAAFIGYQGLLSKILEPQTSLGIHDNAILNVAIYYLPDWLGVGLPVLGLVVYAASVLLNRVQRQRAGLPVPSQGALWARLGIVAVLVLGTIVAFQAYSGVPLVAMILVAIVVVFWLLTTRTAFGRHIYAVGGNAEAARRAGIRVAGLRIALFSLASALAAAGGILLASREGIARADVSPGLLLNAIAAAVIGGVSLFGGRGSVWGVLLGALVIGSLVNGLALSGQSPAVEEMVEGSVLLIAVLLDALARRRSATGLR